MAIKNLNDEEVPEKCQELSEKEVRLEKEIKEAEVALDIKAFAHYPRLTQRIKELAKRYETPLPEIDFRTRELEQKVSNHLRNTGFVWK